MSLTDTVTSILFREIIKNSAIGGSQKLAGTNALNKVLLVDSEAIHFTKELVTTTTLTTNGFITIESITVKLQPLPVHLVFLLNPLEENIARLCTHFEQSPVPWLSAHIFTTAPISGRSMNLIKSCPALLSKIQTLKELNLSFKPEYQSVFTLAPYMDLPFIYATSNTDGVVDDISQRLSAVFVACNDLPTIRYMKRSPLCQSLAARVDSVLDERSKKFPTLGYAGSEKRRSHCLILERCFDPKSPFVHDLTLQSMTFDLMQVKDKVVVLEENSKPPSPLFLDENDSLWESVKDSHIADAIVEITTNFKELTTSRKLKVPDGNTSAAMLRKIMTQYPAYKSELKKYQALTLLVEDLMAKYKNCNLDELVKIEQNLATNESSDGQPVSDNPALYVSILDDLKSDYDKFRLIALFAFKNNRGLSKAIFDKLVSISKVEFAQGSLKALDTLGFPVLEDSSNKRTPKLDQVERNLSDTTGYDSARYVPVLWDVTKKWVSNSLEISDFPFIGDSAPIEGASESGSGGFQFGKYAKRVANVSAKDRPRLYIFILGGITYTEVRYLNYCQKKFPQFEIYLGSTKMITPVRFIQELKSL